MRITSIASLGACLLLASGCIVVSNGGGGGGGNGGGGNGGGGNGTVQRGDLTVLYSFGGRILESAAACDEVGIDTIRVVIAGVNVSDGETKNESCHEFFQGMTVRDFVVGQYDVTVSAQDAGGATLYAMDTAARVTIQANVTTEADLDAPARFGALTVYWTDFGGITGPERCYDADVWEVRVLLYDANDAVIVDEWYDCEDQGVIFDYLPPGTYEVLMNGTDEDGYVVWSGAQYVDVIAGAANAYDVTLEMIVGDLSIFWRFNGSTNCGNVARVQVHLYDPWDDLYDNYVYDCSAGGVEYLNVYAGEYLVVLEAEAQNGSILYRTPEGGVLLDVYAAANNEYYVDLD